MTRIMGSFGRLPWIAVAADHLDHRKATELAHHLGEPSAPLYMCAVWCFFARHYPEGWMPNTDAATAALEREARWRGEAGVLVTALLEVGLLDGSKTRIRVHNWDLRQGPHVERRAKERERKRRIRAERRAERSQDVLRTSAPASRSASLSLSGSPSQSSSPAVAHDEDDQQHGTLPADGTTRAGRPVPPWLDTVWSESLKRQVPPEHWPALDEAVMQTIDVLSAFEPASDEWLAAASDVRKQIESRFSRSNARPL